MKPINNRLIPIFSIILTVLIVIAGLVLYTNNRFHGSSEQLEAGVEPGPKPQPVAQHQKGKAVPITEKRNKMRSPGFDQPDMFAKIHSEARIGGNGQHYPDSYRYHELNSAFSRKYGSITNRQVALKQTLPWVERGPANVGGRTRAILVDSEADPTANTWFAGAVGGGIWKTSDAGQSWTNLTPDLPNLAVTALAKSEFDINITSTPTIYAGTGEGFYNIDAIDGSGIWKSTDRGDSWVQLPATANTTFRSVNRIIADPNNADLVIACANTSRWGSFSTDMLRSTDGGNSWTLVYTSQTYFQAIQQVIANPENFRTLYAALNGRSIIKSTDAGATWQIAFNSFNPPIPTGFGGRIEMAIAPSDTATIYASVDHTIGVRHDLYRSTDAGANWSRIDESNGNNPTMLGAQGWYDNAIAVHPFDKNIVYVAGQRWYRSFIQPNDTRITSRYASFSGPPHVDHHNITIIPLNEGSNQFRIVNGNDGGIWYSDNDGASWNDALNGYNTTQFYGVDKRPGVNEYAGGMQDNGTWQSRPGQDAGPDSDYIFRIGGDGYDVIWNAEKPNEWIGGYQFNGFLLTTDNGNSFTFINDQIESGSGAAPFLSPLANTKSNTELLHAVGSKGVYRSDDFGRNWTLALTAASQWGFNSWTTVEQSLANPQVVWAGTWMNTPGVPNGRIHVSTDGGITFSALDTRYTDSNLSVVTGMATHPLDDSTAYMLFSGAQSPKVIRTTDMGHSWEDISSFGNNGVSSNGFPDVAVFSLLVLPHTPDTLWAGTEVGLFESTDNGQTWAYADNGLPAVSLWQMKVVDDQVVVATHGRGIWSVTIPELPEPPVVNKPPSILGPYQVPGADLVIPLRLKQVYDSTHVYVDNVVYASIRTDLVGDTTLNYPVITAETVNINAIAFAGGVTLPTPTFSVDLSSTSVQSTYVSNFDDFSMTDWIGNDMSIKDWSGFSSPAVHSLHPYPDSREEVYRLIIPIQVAEANANLYYSDVAIVEPGEPGTQYGDFEFWDYVVVEGTSDGRNWQPLADGYDVRLNSAWLNAYSSGASGDSSMFVDHVINLHDSFAAGEVIFIRFRLFADAAVNGWGWVIDNLGIQKEPTAIENINTIPQANRLQQNYPNPFNPMTVISYQLSAISQVNLTIYNALGQRIRTLVAKRQLPGEYQVSWDASNDAGQAVATGVYFYRLEAGSFTQNRKMMLVR